MKSLPAPLAKQISMDFALSRADTDTTQKLLEKIELLIAHPAVRTLDPDQKYVAEMELEKMGDGSGNVDPKARRKALEEMVAELRSNTVSEPIGEHFVNDCTNTLAGEFPALTEATRTAIVDHIVNSRKEPSHEGISNA